MLMYVDYKTIGKRIAQRRHELGLKQSQVNEMAGLSDKYLSNIERATSVMSIDVLMKLCTVLKVTPDYILLGTTTDAVPSDAESAARLEMDTMIEKQIKMILNFIEWVKSQDI